MPVPTSTRFAAKPVAGAPVGPRAPRVLLLDEGFMSGALTATGLRDAGCRVTVLAATGGTGRYRGASLDWALAPPAASADFLLAADAAVRAVRPDVVLPLTEPIQQRLWDAHLPWEPLVYPPTGEWQRRLLGSKLRVAEYVRDVGVAVPAHRAVATERDVRAAVGELRLPVVVKGVRGRGGSATRVVSSADTAAAAARELCDRGGECFVQEYVPGATYLVGGVFHRGAPLRLYAAEKLELHPPRTGPSVRLRSTRDATLLGPALAAFRALGLSGIASADFVRRPQGEYLFLEVNPRPWGSIAAAAEAGVELFAPLAELLGGRTPDPDLHFATGVVSSVFPLYLLARSRRSRAEVVGDVVRDLRGGQGAPWREAGQALHLLHRLLRVWRNWERA